MEAFGDNVCFQWIIDCPKRPNFAFDNTYLRRKEKWWPHPDLNRGPADYELSWLIDL